MTEARSVIRIEICMVWADFWRGCLATTSKPIEMNTIDISKIMNRMYQYSGGNQKECRSPWIGGTSNRG